MGLFGARAEVGVGGALFRHADAVTQRLFGEEVYYRGICEVSNVCNVCTNDCGYCGIKKHPKGVALHHAL